MSGVEFNQERAAVWMVAPAEAATPTGFAGFIDGPSRSGLSLVGTMRPGDIIVGMNRHGRILVQEQMLDGQLHPWAAPVAPASQG